nr:hypothetical protein CFP56_41321 [Quercus suber]
MDQYKSEHAGSNLDDATIKSESTSYHMDGTEALMDGNETQVGSQVSWSLLHSVALRIVLCLSRPLFMEDRINLNDQKGTHLRSSMDSEFGSGPAGIDRTRAGTYHAGLLASSASRTPSPSVLAPIRRKEEPNYQALPRDAYPQIDDAEATAMILEGKLKGNARHRAGPNYFRRKGRLYTDKYYLLEQRDGSGRLIISHEKAVGCFDTARHRYNDGEGVSPL